MNATRRNRRQEKQSAGQTRAAIINEIMNASRTRSTSGPNDPPRTMSIKTTQRIEMNFNTTGTALPVISATDILNSVPGNGTAVGSRGLFKKFRILKVSFWNVGVSGTDSLSLNFLIGDTTVFRDDGVPGARAGALHLLPPMALAQQWLTDSSGPVMNTNLGSGTTTGYVMHVTVELTSG